MCINLTLKNIPEAVYQQLKLSAQLHRRSMNSEAILCLEAVLLPSQDTADEKLAHAQAIRNKLKTHHFSAKDIDTLKQAGRP